MGELSNGRARNAANAVRRNGLALGGRGFLVVVIILVAARMWSAFSGKKRKGQIVEVERGAAARPASTARQGVLLLAVHEDPLGDARLDVGFDELVHDIDQFFAEIGAIVQASQLEGLERNGGAGGEVFEHRLAGLHAGPPAFNCANRASGGCEAKGTPDGGTCQSESYDTYRYIMIKVTEREQAQAAHAVKQNETTVSESQVNRSGEAS